MDFDRMDDARENRGRLNARLELAMMTGNVVLLNNEKDIKYALDYILSAIGSDKTGEDIYDAALRYSDKDETRIAGISTSMVYGDPCINVILCDKNEELCLDRESGILCYVFNSQSDICSELGFCFFEKRDNDTYHRIS